MVLQKFDEVTLKELRSCKELRSIRLISKALSVKPHTLSKAADSGRATNRVVTAVTKYFNDRRDRRDVVSVVCEHFGITPELLAHRSHVEARQIAAFMLHTYEGKSKGAVADILQYSDHTGAMKAINRISDLIISDVALRRTISFINEKING